MLARGAFWLIIMFAVAFCERLNYIQDKIKMNHFRDKTENCKRENRDLFGKSQSYYVHFN